MSGLPSEVSMGPGFFGKLPSRGDFLSRRVPASIAPTWEAWLSTLVVAARDALGEDWPDDWLTAPLWHATLGAGLLPPHGGAAVLLASVDRVGRMFPFTIIGAATPRPTAGCDRAVQQWQCEAETLALDALEDDFDPDRLDAALARLGAPPPSVDRDAPTGVQTIAIEGDWPAPPDGNVVGATPAAPGARQSVWWCRGSGRVSPVWLCCDGLPARQIAAAMITGDFGFAPPGAAEWP